MRIIAIDPGFERIGIAVVEKNDGKEKLMYSECFKTKKGDLFETRLVQIGEKMTNIIKEWSPEALAIETLFFNTNKKTASRVSEARGVIIHQFAKFNLPIYEYTPLQIKIAVSGYGRAPKKQVDDMVRSLITIEKDAINDDEMDAIAIGITCLASILACSKNSIS